MSRGPTTLMTAETRARVLVLLAELGSPKLVADRLGVSVRGRGPPRVHRDETVTAVVACVRAGEPVERVARACGMGVRTLYTRMEEAHHA